jgi:hypothetical protein
VPKRAIEITGELAALIERISARPRERLSAWLIQDDDGKPLGTFGLRSRFDKARRAAGVEFQFRDIRAKAATDTGDLAHSQKLLGHRNREMTEHHVRQRIGEKVRPHRYLRSLNLFNSSFTTCPNAEAAMRLGEDQAVAVGRDLIEATGVRVRLRPYYPAH